MLKEEINYNLFMSILQYDELVPEDYALSIILKGDRHYLFKDLVTNFNNIMVDNNLNISIDRQGYIHYSTENDMIIFKLKYI